VNGYYFSGYKNWKDYARGFERIVKLRNGSDAFDRFHLAIALAKTGQADEARSWFNRGVEWMEQHKGSEDEELVKLQGEAKKVIENWAWVAGALLVSPGIYAWDHMATQTRRPARFSGLPRRDVP